MEDTTNFCSFSHSMIYIDQNILFESKVGWACVLCWTTYRLWLCRSNAMIAWKLYISKPWVIRTKSCHATMYGMTKCRQEKWFQNLIDFLHTRLYFSRYKENRYGKNVKETTTPPGSVSSQSVWVKYAQVTIRIFFAIIYIISK